MKKLAAIMAPLALAACVCGILRADDSPPPTASQGSSVNDTNAYLWSVEHSAAVAKDADASGVQAVMEAKDLLRSKEPQVEIDFFTKTLYDVKSRAVQREIRMTLSKLYKEQGQTDKAMDQLQQLMMDQ